MSWRETKPIEVSGISTLQVTDTAITIVDNDSARLSITGPAGEVEEGGQALFIVSISNPVAADVDGGLLDVGRHCRVR